MTDTTPTPADRPADQLRAAAVKLRAAAMGSPMNSSPWRYAKGLPSDSVRTEVGWEVVYGDAPGDLRYIALMHPGVGLALAAVLESAAERLGDTGASLAALLDPSALAVARQLLGLHETCMTPQATRMSDTAPVWVDGDPLMEAMAAAVWEQCRTENSIVVDDPRNIAAVAAPCTRPGKGHGRHQLAGPHPSRVDAAAASAA
ncbi:MULTISPECIES: hypothetical protein [Streptomyces]|uniref:hypothetical protein n=1 Tax=Streptomyces TaxID=1883 RepID=UPI00103F995E|nr:MULTISPECIES: hypothetical protein [Streptomyces]MBT3077591.1 hypothetical protein [Streptomyces sp. COG21]MBT3084436.1 hypothetical protein [Streptomyces sp. COG20]MBT3085343.1 hypothetical protein [Streptomyces sp. CYG21]MBT3103614.1 hypothetical protein [Streptomyces sp. COG19]MBT3111303.1 hypothetical protein [Streptomyces sp. CYG20]